MHLWGGGPAALLPAVLAGSPQDTQEQPGGAKHAQSRSPMAGPSVAGSAPTHPYVANRTGDKGGCHAQCAQLTVAGEEKAGTLRFSKGRSLVAVLLPREAACAVQAAA